MKKDYYLPKMNLVLVRKVFISLVLSIILFSGGYVLGRNGYVANNVGIAQVSIDRESPQNKKEVDFNLFWKVWDAVEKDYFDKTKLNAQNMVYGAIKGMVSSIGDPYTAFLPPDENKVVEQDLEGSFEGVGIQIGFRGSRLAVVAPLPSSPAEKSGIKAGDYIDGIKDEKKGIETGTAGMNLTDAVQLIRGERGTQITLSLTRDGVVEPIIVDVIRDEIDVPSVILSFEGENKDIAYMRLLKFSAETNSEWEKAASEVKRKRPKAIILDLRNNPGGYLQGAVDIAGDFLSNGALVTIEEFADGTRNEFRTDRTPSLVGYKTVVLINKGSASASEILAGALREKGQIKLIGESTFGKGIIQEPRQINGGASLHITTAKWLTPNGNWVNEKGLDPDIEVVDNPETEEDEQFQESLSQFK